MGVFAFMDSIPKTKYLSAENCAAYRFIMRLFYLEYQKMSYQQDPHKAYTIADFKNKR